MEGLNIIKESVAQSMKKCFNYKKKAIKNNCSIKKAIYYKFVQHKNQKHMRIIFPCSTSEAAHYDIVQKQQKHVTSNKNRRVKK